MTEDCGVIHKMRTATLAEECGKNPKVVSLKFAEPPKGGEFKISKSYLRTEPPKVVSLKLIKLS